jgi:predicted MFS family arabinose efflux permease
MVPVISQKDFMLAPWLVGVMSSLEGFGGTVGAILVGALGSERTLFRFYYLGPVAMMLLMLALSLDLQMTLAVPILLLMGMAVASFTATQYALVHVSSPPEHRGRATGILSIFIGSSMFGHYLAGQLFDAFPSATAMRLMAVGGLVAMAILGALWMTSRTPRPGEATLAGERKG